jgi:hypothetical protein
MKRETAVQNRKLTSLLALSAGAVALPQAADALVIYSGTINEKVGFSGGFGPAFTVDLPGTANLLLQRGSSSSTYLWRWVSFRQFGTGAYARLRAFSTGGTNFAKRNNAGETWNAITGSVLSSASIGVRVSSTIQGPGAFNNKYIAFMFKDSTQGDADRYGWALMSMDISDTTGPDVTLQSWAYDDTGAMIAMGDGAAVPEPSSAVLMAMGALVLGSRGVRRWRSQKQETVKV